MRRKRKKLSPAELIRTKREFCRLVRDSGYKMSQASRALGLPRHWCAYQRENDPEFAEELRKARANIRPSANWRDAFVQVLRKGGSRNEALDSLRESYPGVTAKQVEERFADDDSFRSALEEIEIRDVWEVRHNLAKRAKSSASDARLFLSKVGDVAYAGQPDPDGETPESAAPPAGEFTPGDQWVDSGAEAEAKSWVEEELDIPQRLNEGDMRVLGSPLDEGVN